jgi:hypothetical protein
MNTYMKVTILVLASVCFALGALVYKSQSTLASVKPLSTRTTTSATLRRLTTGTSNIVPRKQKTSTTWRAGPSSISRAIVCPPRPPFKTGSCSGP